MKTGSVYLFLHSQDSWLHSGRFGSCESQGGREVRRQLLNTRGPAKVPLSKMTAPKQWTSPHSPLSLVAAVTSSLSPQPCRC